MKSKEFSLVRYDADDGKVFDWKEPRYTEDENENQVQEHLYTKTLFIGGNDTIDNYIEVDAPFTYEETDRPIEGEGLPNDEG
jgi:hypothetical protein